MSYDIQIGLATRSEEADIRKRRHRPPYSLESFLEWEEEAAARGATQWVMYKEPQTAPETQSHSSDRTVMGSFQTIPRRALVASRRAGGQVQVDKVSCTLIQSMFVFEEFRRQGLAAKALRLIKDQLAGHAEEDPGDIKFLYLYSYVGPELYTQGGWTSFPATYATLPTVSSPETASALGEVEPFDVKEVEKLCLRDEELVREELLHSYTSGNDAKTKFVVLADWPAISWLEACEEHVARETNTGALSLKGARARTRAGTVWCLWTRIFRGNGEIDFQILRSRVDAAAAVNGSSELPAEEVEDQITSGLAAVLRTAQIQAGRWGCNNVTMKNPPPRLVRAAQRIDPSAQLIPRSEICLPFLHWYGGAEEEETPEWLQNESHGDF